LLEAKLIRPPHTWAPVHQNLQSRYAKEIFVIGDASALPKPVGKQAFKETLHNSAACVLAVSPA
jgi:NADH dehydrogenase FAD-containing subunit